MKIPTVLRYGVRMVVTLAQNGKIMNTVELAKEMGVSPLYLRQVALPLERTGIIKGFRGAKGGYLLAIRPAEINLLYITQAYDEDFSLLDCVKTPNSCPQRSRCPSRYLWQELSESVKNFLQNMTLEDLIAREKGE